MAESPFLRTPLAEGERFADRIAELARLDECWKTRGSALVLYGPRRMGKSALLAEAARRLRQHGRAVVVVDLATAVDAPDAVRRLLTAVRDGVGHTWRSLMQGVAAKLRLSLTLTPNPDGTGLPGLSLSFDQATPASQLFTDALVAVNDELVKRRMHLALGIDEFQRLLEWGGTDVEWALKSVLERHGRISYVLAGSATTLIEEMVTNRERALWKLADYLSLGPIPAGEFAQWIVARTARGRTKISAPAAERIVTLSGPRTRDVITLAHAVWRDATLSGRSANADRALDALIDETAAPSERTWDQCTQREQRLLRLLASDPAVELTADAIRRRHALGAASSVGVALSGLRKKGLLDAAPGRPMFEDPFFRRWVQRETTQDL